MLTNINNSCLYGYGCIYIIGNMYNYKQIARKIINRYSK